MLLCITLKKLMSQNIETRRMAAEKLAKSKDIRAVDALILTLKDEAASVRMAAAKSLGEIGDPRATSHLVKQLTENLLCRPTDPTTCRTIAKAIAQIGSVTDVETQLLEALQTDDPYVRLYCFVVLKRNSIQDVLENGVNALVGDISSEIRRLYSLTVEVNVNEGIFWATGGSLEPSYETVHSPDTDGIRNIISYLPQSIRESVFELSGDAKYLFTDEYSRRTLLRSSERVAHSPDQLLRPANGKVTTPPDQLLRPADKGD